MLIVDTARQPASGAVQITCAADQA